MMYPFMTLDDGAEIVHSEMQKDGAVKVYVEKPDAADCFHHAVCWLPAYRWEDVFGFSQAELARYDGACPCLAGDSDRQRDQNLDHCGRGLLFVQQ